MKEGHHLWDARGSSARLPKRISLLAGIPRERKRQKACSREFRERENRKMRARGNSAREKKEKSLLAEFPRVKKSLKSINFIQNYEYQSKTTPVP